MAKKNKKRGPDQEQHPHHSLHQKRQDHRNRRRRRMLSNRINPNQQPEKQPHHLQQQLQQHHLAQQRGNTLEPRRREYDSSSLDINTSQTHPIVISDDDDEENNNEYIAERTMWRTIQRRWTSAPHDRYDTFTVMTYNLLSNRLALKNPHLYKQCAKSDIKWENRSQVLMQELRSQMLDIYCLQEIDREHYVVFFQPIFREWGYSGVFKKRNGNKPDGCAIFFRNKTVKAVKLLGVNFDENTFTKKENIGIVGIFDIKHQERTRRICLATSHIIFHPTYGMTKIAQLRMLLDSAREMIEKQNADIPLVLCGDFNALPYSTVIRYLTDESIDVSALPEWRLSGQQQAHPSTTFTPPYENKLTAFRRAFPDNGHGFSPISNTTTPTPLTNTNAGPAAPSVSTTTASKTTTTSSAETATTMEIQSSALVWSASSLRSLIRKSKNEWNESAEPTTNTNAATTTTTVASSAPNANTTSSNFANTHIVFNSDGSSSTTTSTTHMSRPHGLICQPFSLRSAYPFSASEETAQRLGLNRAPKGGPWTTFHSGGKLVCDYIFHGQLRVPVTPDLTNSSSSHPDSMSNTAAAAVAVPQKLQVDGILELPCADLLKRRVQSLPSPDFGSDHLSLVARFRFV